MRSPVSPLIFPPPRLPNTRLPPSIAPSPNYLKDGVADGRFKQHQHGEAGSGRCAARREFLQEWKSSARPRQAKHKSSSLSAKRHTTLPKRSTADSGVKARTRFSSAKASEMTSLPTDEAQFGALASGSRYRRHRGRWGWGGVQMKEISRDFSGHEALLRSSPAAEIRRGRAWLFTSMF